MKVEPGDTEDGGASSDGTDHESIGCSRQTQLVTSSTNGSHKTSSVTPGSPVSAAAAAAAAAVANLNVNNPFKRSLDMVTAVNRALSNALLVYGSDVVNANAVAAAAAAAANAAAAAAAASSTTPNLAYTGDANLETSKSSSPDGSQCASPLMLLGSSKSKGRSTDSPGSASSAIIAGSSSGTTAANSASSGSAGNRDKPFLCQICNKTFGYKHVLQNHERTHTGEKPFQCRTCDKKFTRDHHLKTHMRLHTGEKPYHCDVCNKDFVQVANLRRHVRVHTGEKPYLCEICPQKFSDSNQLKAHKLIHKGEKPYGCDKCLGRFRRRHHMINHKCPRDEANTGRPRRGRRPKVLPLVATTPVSASTAAGSMPFDSTAAMLFGNRAAAAAAAGLTLASLANSLASVGSGNTTGDDHMPSATVSSSSPSSSSGLFGGFVSPPVAHSASDCVGVGKSRRKSTPFRYMKDSRDFERFITGDDMQTQPLNMSTTAAYGSPDATGNGGKSSSQSKSGLYLHDDVLDLSRSRSDVDDDEPIEESMVHDEDEIEENDEDDDEDEDEHDEERFYESCKSPLPSTEIGARLSMQLLSGQAANLVVKDKLTDLSSEILLRKKLHLNDTSNNNNEHHHHHHHLNHLHHHLHHQGNGGLKDELSDNGTIQLTKTATTTSCS